MKRLIAVGCLIGSLASSAVAWEFKDNPDRFISVGINSGMTHLSGSNNNELNVNTPSEALEPQTQKYNINSFGFDIRVPMSTFVTFSLSYDKLRLDSESIRAGNTFQNHQGLDGDRLTFGLRFYLDR